MSKYFNQNETPDDGDNKKIVFSGTWQEYGKSVSVDNRGNIICFLESLSTIYSGHVISQKDRENENTKLLKPLEDEIKIHEHVIVSKDLEMKQSLPEKINTKSQQIAECEEELVDLENTDPEIHLRRNGERLFSNFKYYSTSFFLTILTLTILYFYSNVSWVIWSLPESLTDAMAYGGCSPGVFNSFSTLFGYDACNTAAGVPSIMLPLLFLTFAYLIHLVISSELKYKLLKSSAIVLIVLIVDVALAVMFEMKILTMDGSIDIYDKPNSFMEKLNYVLNTDNFILILCFGFFSYIFWSVLLYFYEDEAKLKNPFIALNREISAKHAKLSKLKEERNDLKGEINNIPPQITEIRGEIQKLKNKVKIAEIGGEEELKKRISEFTSGWIQFIQFKFDSDPVLRDEKVSEIIAQRNDYLKNKSITS